MFYGTVQIKKKWKRKAWGRFSSVMLSFSGCVF